MDISSEQLTNKISTGEIKFHDLDGLVGYKKAAEIRLLFLKNKLSLDLSSISSYTIDPEKCKPNIENMIGAVQIPLGIAGQIKVKGDYANGEFYIPLATTEGALVASVNRGCSVINKSGGADVLILADEQSRSILFKASSLSALKKFYPWMASSKENLRKIGEAGESHLKIKDFEIYAVGLNIWLRIKASTDDAMGMNMITIAGKKIGDHISKNFEDIEFLSETGNMCTDKKPSAMNLINSRGK
ncbi:MAG: 3-hydroxy-3-methylglutaryl-CoA reductase, partial [archaeon]